MQKNSSKIRLDKVTWIETLIQIRILYHGNSVFPLYDLFYSRHDDDLPLDEQSGSPVNLLNLKGLYTESQVLTESLCVTINKEMAS